MKDEFLPHLQENAHRGVSPKSDDSNSQFSFQILIVVFGGDVRRTEGVKMDSQFIRPPKVSEGGNSSHKIFSAGVMLRRSHGSAGVLIGVK